MAGWGIWIWHIALLHKDTWGIGNIDSDEVWGMQEASIGEGE